MKRSVRLFIAVSTAGLALTGCATGLTAGDRAAQPASVVAAADNGAVDIPSSDASVDDIATSAAPATTDSAAETDTASAVEQDSAAGGEPDSGLSVGPDGVTAPGLSVGPDGVTAPGLSVGPDGVVVESTEPDDGLGTAPAESAPFVNRACGDGEQVTVSQPGSTLYLTGDCASVTVVADDAFVSAEAVGALDVTGSRNTIYLTSHTALEVSGDNNFISYSSADGPAPVDTGSGNTLIG